MGRKRFQPEEIISKLHEAEVFLAKGDTAGQVVRFLGVTEQTFYRWRKEHGDLTVDQAKGYKEMEQENHYLKKLVGDLSMDNAILMAFNQGKYRARQSEYGGTIHVLRTIRVSERQVCRVIIGQARSTQQYRN